MRQRSGRILTAAFLAFSAAHFQALAAEAGAKSPEQEIAPYTQDDSPELIRMPDGEPYAEYVKFSPAAKKAYLDYFDSETEGIHVSNGFLLAGGGTVLGIFGYVYYSGQAITDASSKVTRDRVSNDNTMALVVPALGAVLATIGIIDGIHTIRDVAARNRATRSLRQKLKGGEEGRIQFEIHPVLSVAQAGPVTGLELSLGY
jgi:hypothetical protein